MVDTLDILFKHFAKQLSPENVFRTQLIQANAKQRYVVIHQYYAFISSKFYAMPNVARFQFLSVDINEVRSRELASFINSTISEKYNFDLDSNGDLSESGTYHIATVKSIQLPISQGLITGGGWQYSQNFEVKF